MIVFCGIIFVSLMSLQAQGQTNPGEEIIKQNPATSKEDA